ncbi:hypothetical protein ACE3MS_00565 [Paenibacillus dendritiformis]|uniref:hypothetical protein n=1 Tax=Paenibacillus dendritiformis TaxID=130049 RepID=UPI0036565A20
MPELVSAQAWFHTNDDDKDHDTGLTITIEKGHDLFAKSDVIMGTFDNHSDNGPYGLHLLGQISKSQLEGATTPLSIQPDGNDTWRFNYFLELGYNDGTRQKWEWFGNTLKEGRGDRKTFNL